MYSSLLSDVRFHRILWQLDEQSAREVKSQGCHRGNCRGALHSARYLRKPRGIAGVLDGCECWRLSFCCAKDGCRGRTTPPSLRFLGPKVYLAGVITVITAMRCGASPARMQRLKALVGVSRQTVVRWQRWWREVLPQSVFWRAACGTFRSVIRISELPVSLLEQFSGGVEERLLRLLSFLAPLTGGRCSPQGPVTSQAR
jgi:hypothetical protein